MYEHLKSCSPSCRTQLVLDWKALSKANWRWFALLEIPVWFGALSWYQRHDHSPKAIIVLILPSALAYVLTWVGCTGVSSSNHGTYFREKEPLRYWLDFGVMIFSYGLLLFGAFIG